MSTVLLDGTLSTNGQRAGSLNPANPLPIAPSLPATGKLTGTRYCFFQRCRSMLQAHSHLRLQCRKTPSPFKRKTERGSVVHLVAIRVAAPSCHSDAQTGKDEPYKFSLETF